MSTGQNYFLSSTYHKTQLGLLDMVKDIIKNGGAPNRITLRPNLSAIFPVYNICGQCMIL